MPHFGPEQLAHLRKDVQQIIGALTLPEVFKQCPRYNGQGTGKGTVAKTLKQEFNISWTSSVDTNLKSNENQIFQFRNLLRNLIYYFRQCPVFDYQWLNPAGVVTWGLLQFGKTTLNSGVWAVSLSGAQPHGTKLFPGRGKGQSGIWVDNDGTGSCTLQIVFQVAGVPTAPGANTTVTSRYWTGKDWGLNKSFVCGAGTTQVNHAPPVGGAYMYWEVDAPAAGLPANMVAVIDVVASQPSDVWAHRAVTNIDELLPIIQGVRVNGGVAWLRNESPEMYEQGKIVGVDVAKTLPWSNLATGSAAIAQLDEYYSGKAALGAYAFLTPDDEEDFDMSDDISSYALKGSAFNMASFPLKERSPYISMAVSAGDQNSNSRNISLVSYAMIEYYSNSAIQQKEDSEYSPEAWEIAIEFMKHMDQFYENKFHISDIFDAIARYGGPISIGAAEILSKFPQTAFIGEAIKGEGFQNAIKRLGSAAAEDRARKRLKG